VDEPAQGPVPASELRVSDAEREVTLAALREHTAIGRLTMEEFDERADRVLAAKTYGELALVTRDLPDLPAGAVGQRPAPSAAAVPDGPRRQVSWMVAIMSGSRRSGRLRLSREVNMISIMGGDELDLRDAEIEGGQATITAISVMGGSTFYVPDTMNVEVTGFSLMGGNTELGVAAAPAPGAPTVTIRTFNLMGGCTIWRLPQEARDVSLHQARRLAKSARRGRLGPPMPPIPPGPGY